VSDDFRYTRIGDLWHCNECDEDLRGLYEVAVHNMFEHVWEFRAARRAAERLRDLLQ